jgi:hypothetical protein
MTTIKSGFFTTPVSTPSGQRKKIAVDNPYLTKDEYITSVEASGLGLTTSSPIYTSGELDKILLRASAWINRYCNRYFDTQTIDETKTQFMVRPYNPQLVTVVLNNRPYQQVHSVYIQVLKWFIQVDVTSPGCYMQDFPDYGYFKIVPLLSSAGTGAGSPIPAAILDHVPLGVLWTNYTFGYGTNLIAEPLTQIGVTKSYQAPLGNRLWAPDQPKTIYDNATAVADANIESYDYPNGIVTFKSSYTVVGPITATFTTNESLPFDIKEACILLASHIYGQATQNALGVQSYGIQTYNVTFGDGSQSGVYKRVEQLLEAYKNNMPAFF